MKQNNWRFAVQNKLQQKWKGLNTKNKNITSALVDTEHENIHGADLGD